MSEPDTTQEGGDMDGNHPFDIRLSARWLDISTAPVTGPAFLVACPERRNVYLVIRHNGQFEHFSPGADPLREVPTHWMPLSNLGPWEEDAALSRAVVA